MKELVLRLAEEKRAVFKDNDLDYMLELGGDIMCEWVKQQYTGKRIMTLSYTTLSD